MPGTDSSRQFHLDGMRDVSKALSQHWLFAEAIFHWVSGEMQLTTTLQGSAAGAALFPHSSLSCVTSLGFSQPCPSCGFAGSHASILRVISAATCPSTSSPRHFVPLISRPQPGARYRFFSSISPRWHEGCVQCPVPALALCRSHVGLRKGLQPMAFELGLR